MCESMEIEDLGVIEMGDGAVEKALVTQGIMNIGAVVTRLDLPSPHPIQWGEILFGYIVEKGDLSVATLPSGEVIESSSCRGPCRIQRIEETIEHLLQIKLPFLGLKHAVSLREKDLIDG